MLAERSDGGAVPGTAPPVCFTEAFRPGRTLPRLRPAHARHSHRQAYIELSRLQKTRDAFNVEFRRLQTEQATVSETNRIVGIATEKLGMHFPLENETTVVQP